MRSSSRHAFLAGALLGLAALPGCLQVPNVYQMRPLELEERRRSIHSVGLVLVEYPPASEQVRPGRGVFGGAWRGLVRGASLPLLVGFVAPVPGGTFLGLLVAPFTAVAGATYGAFVGVSGRNIDVAASTLTEIERQHHDMRGEKLLLKELQALGKTADLRFELLPELGPADPEEWIAYDELGLAPLDAVLEVRVDRQGLTGAWSINPPTRCFVEITVRVYAVADNELLFEESFACSSEAERTFTEWAQEDGAAFREELIGFTSEAADKIVSDLFLVYPLP